MCSASAAAEGVTEQLYLQELPTVLTVSRLAQPQREAPAMVTVIDRRMIEASGFTQIADLMRLVPGFQVTYKYGWQPVVTYHGLSDAFSRRLQVLVDGRSIFNPSFGQVDWRELPLALEDIERIEVVHGPAAAAYGSNAFLATINIVTLQGGDDPGTQFAIGRGHRDIASHLLRHSGRRGDLAWRVSLLDRRDRRFEVNPDEARDRILNARLDYQLDARDALMLQVGASRSDWDMGDLDDAIADPPRTGKNDNHFVQLRWQRLEGGGREHSLQYTRSRKRYDNDWWIAGLKVGPFTLPAFPASYDHSVLREQLEFQATRPLGEQTRAVYGAEVRRDEVQSPFFFHPGATLSETMYRLFGSLEWRPAPEWLFNAGGMLEEHYFAGSTFSPRLSLHYLPSPNHAFRLGASRGYRSQTFVEQAGDSRLTLQTGLSAPWPGTVNDRMQIPAPDLEPERIDSADLGYVGGFPELGLSVNARLFHDRLRRLIEGNTVEGVGDIDGKARQYANLVDSRQWGAEYQLQWQPDGSTRVIFGQAWIWQDAEARRADALTDAREYESSAPRLSLSLLLMKDLGQGWQASLGYYRLGRMTWLAEGDRLDRYGRVDARLAKSWRAGGGSYELALALQNLAGPYQDFEEGAAHTYSARQGYITFRLWL